MQVFVYENNGTRHIAIHSGFGASWPLDKADELRLALDRALARAYDPTPLPEPIITTRYAAHSPDLEDLL
jgi:hypothetical protein